MFRVIIQAKVRTNRNIWFTKYQQTHPNTNSFLTIETKVDSKAQPKQINPKRGAFLHSGYMSLIVYS